MQELTFKETELVSGGQPKGANLEEIASGAAIIGGALLAAAALPEVLAGGALIAAVAGGTICGGMGTALIMDGW